jgi:Dolichyl-phosphate-mannose-protein mannosyltransferase
MNYSLGCVRWNRFGQLSARHLDHDELFTFYIAQAPSLGQLLNLTQTVDLHPPLSYLFVRFSFALFGVSTWSCRLPTALAFVLTTALLFWLLKRMFSPVYGLIVGLVLWSGPYTYLAPDRPPLFLAALFHQPDAGELVSGNRKYRPSPLGVVLDMDGAKLKIVGTYANTIDEHELYEISVPANPYHSSQ